MKAAAMGLVYGAIGAMVLFFWLSGRRKNTLPGGEDRRDVETVKRAVEQAERIMGGGTWTL